MSYRLTPQEMKARYRAMLMSEQLSVVPQGFALLTGPSAAKRQEFDMSLAYTGGSLPAVDNAVRQALCDMEREITAAMAKAATSLRAIALGPEDA